MHRISIIPALLIVFSLLFLPAAASASDQTLTQRDWMVNLVDALGYSFGLPDSPEEADYIALLEGRRSYRFEAETYRNLDDLAAVNNFSSFGAFSGTGWVSAISAPTKVRLDFLLPHSGTYRLFAAVRIAGHTFAIDGQKFSVSENFLNFERVDLGDVTLIAGMKEMIVDMPANGSIDYIELSAPPLPVITPLGGWKTSTLLTKGDLAVTALRALELQSLLPAQEEKIYLEAEVCSVDKTCKTDQRHLGEPHGGFWLRTGGGGGDITLPFKVDKEGVYTLYLKAAGSTPLSGSLDDLEPWTTSFPPYLENKSIGTWFLTADEHKLLIRLPPRGGVDLLSIEPRRSDSDSYKVLAGLSPGEGIRAEELNRLLTLLARLYSQK